jgi:predicted nucleotidyltransferase
MHARIHRKSDDENKEYLLMVTISSEVISESIRSFVSHVLRKYRVEGIYLFGSQVTGQATEWSDIDLLVISPDFKSDRHESRLELMRIARKIDHRIEPHPMTPDEFNPSNPIADEVQRNGIKILSGVLDA